MIVVFGLLDRALDIVGLAALVWWTYKGTVRYFRWKHGKTET